MMLLQCISLIFSHQIYSKSIKSTKKSTFFFYFFLFFLLQPTAVKVIQGRRLKTHKNKNNRCMSVETLTPAGVATSIKGIHLPQILYL